MRGSRAALVAFALSIAVPTHAGSVPISSYASDPCAGKIVCQLKPEKYLACLCDGRWQRILIVDPAELPHRPDLHSGENAFPMSLNSQLLGSGSALLVTRNSELQRLFRTGFTIRTVTTDRNGESTVVIGPSAGR